MSLSSEQNNCDVHLYAEVEVLKQALIEKQNQLIAMETACLQESDRQCELEDSIIAWQDKYDRLYESHKRVQKVNQSLEDKLLKLVDRNSGERAQLTSDVATLSVRLAQANYNIAKLQREIERYKTDINLAIQLLQCKPDNFIPQKVSSLPMDIQSKISSYMRLDTNSHSDSEGSTSGVGVITSGSYKVIPASDSPPTICPFPPTAMVFSMRGLDAQNSDLNENTGQMISASVMAKYLEDELKLSEVKHCDTCKCANRDLTVLVDEPKTFSIATQTVIQGEGNSLCLRCNSNLNSPSRTNSPFIMKLVKSSDSVISETKSSMSDINENDKLFTPVKKDDLMVNPILGHHRLCDRTINKQYQLNDTAKYVIKNLSTDLNSSYNGNCLQEKQNHKFNTKNDIVDDKLIEIKNNGEISSRNDSFCINSDKDITGSTNSLWSRTSSSEGAKVFENFNRNLIKTIKAENPQHQGPRLCSVRIQSGTSNILLDNIDTEIESIIYTRRQKFLDEELDDTKDIITSKISMLMSDKASILCSSTNPSKKSTNDTKNLENNTIINPPNHNNKINHSIDKSFRKKEKISSINVDSFNKQNLNIVDNLITVENNQSTINNLCDKNIVELEEKLPSNINVKTKGIIEENKTDQGLISDCKSINLNSDVESYNKSSTSNSSGNNVDGNVLLRCQQLTRVAEWVQHNSMIDKEKKQSKRKSLNNINLQNVNNNSINSIELNNSKNLLIPISKQNYENQYSTIKNKSVPISCNLLINTNYNQNNIIPDNIISIQEKSNENIFNKKSSYNYLSNTLNAQNYKNDCIEKLNNNIKNKNFNDNIEKLNSDLKHQDLAQMEYNVKQFLLKQNEWSIRNANCKLSVATVNNFEQATNLLTNCNSNDGKKLIPTHPYRTETNL